MGIAETTSAQVDQAENEGGEGEGGETKWSGVGEFTTLDGFVETWLELTTECWDVG